MELIKLDRLAEIREMKQAGLQQAAANRFDEIIKITPEKEAVENH